MRKSVATAIGFAVAATVTVGALAIASNTRVSGPQAAQAARAAIQAAGGEWATLKALPESGAAWKFQVTRIDGSKVDVLLDDQFRVVNVGDESVSALAASNNPVDGHRSDTHDSEQPVPTADSDRAAQAALKATGGGTVHDVDRDSEGGSTWEVEITRPDGKAVDALLNQDFRVLSVGDEREANEGRDADDKTDDRDDD